MSHMVPLNNKTIVRFFAEKVTTVELGFFLNPIKEVQTELKITLLVSAVFHRH